MIAVSFHGAQLIFRQRGVGSPGTSLLEPRILADLADFRRPINEMPKTSCGVPASCPNADALNWGFAMIRPFLLVVTAGALFTAATPDCPAADASHAPQGWEAAAPRDEIRPRFSFEPSGGHREAPRLIIEADGREGLDGYWSRSFPVHGREFFEFRAYRRVDSVATPRRSCLITLTWLDAAGRMVTDDRPVVTRYTSSGKPMAEVEHPVDHQTDEKGWTQVSTVYRVPQQASQARIELHLLWAPGGALSGATFP